MLPERPGALLAAADHLLEAASRALPEHRVAFLLPAATALDLAARRGARGTRIESLRGWLWEIATPCPEAA